MKFLEAFFKKRVAIVLFAVASCIILLLGVGYRVNSIKDSSFQEGYDKGFQKGKANGYRLGYNEGYSQGENDGLNKGQRYGYAQGYNDTKIRTET